MLLGSGNRHYYNVGPNYYYGDRSHLCKDIYSLGLYAYLPVLLTSLIPSVVEAIDDPDMSEVTGSTSGSSLVLNSSEVNESVNVDVSYVL